MRDMYLRKWQKNVVDGTLVYWSSIQQALPGTREGGMSELLDLKNYWLTHDNSFKELIHPPCHIEYCELIEFSNYTFKQTGQIIFVESKEPCTAESILQLESLFLIRRLGSPLVLLRAVRVVKTRGT